MSKNSRKLKRYIRKQIKKYVKENNIFVFAKLPEVTEVPQLPKHTNFMPTHSHCYYSKY